MCYVMKAILPALFLLTPLVASSATDLKVAVWEGAAPFFQKTEAGWKGPCTDIFRAIEELEPQIRFVTDPEPMPLRRVEYEMQAGRRDIVCGARKSAAREDAGFQFLKNYLHITGYRLAVRASDNIQVKSWEDVRLTKDRVLILQGHADIPRLQAMGIQLDSSAPSAEQNLIKLIGGRARFFYARDSYFKSTEFLARGDRQVKVLPVLFDPSPAFIATSKNVSAELYQLIDQAYAKLLKNGEVARILRTHGIEN